MTLTPDQRRLMQQLPPSQRDALLRAIEKAAADKAEKEGMEFPNLVEFPEREKEDLEL